MLAERRLSELAHAGSMQLIADSDVQLKTVGLRAVPFGTSADAFSQGDNMAGLGWGVVDGVLLFAPGALATAKAEAQAANATFRAERQLVRSYYTVSVPPRAVGGASVLPESVSHPFGHGASIRSINPGRYTVNCPECTVYVDDLLAGRGLNVARNSGMMEIRDFEKALTRHFGRPMEFGELGALSTIEAEIARAGPGARGIVFAHKGVLEEGHYFNVVNQRGVVRFLDGQSGTAARVGEFVEFSYVRTK